MNDILDPAEFDALMSKPADAGQSAGDRYDFAGQDYAVQRLIPALSLVHAQFAEAIKLRLRQLIPELQAVRAERVAVMKFGELQRMLPTPSDISVISAPPLAGPMFLVFEADLVFGLVNHFFGGQGGGARRRSSEFSPSESRFMQQLGKALLPDLAQGWHSVVELSPQLLERHSDLRFVDSLDQRETLLAARFSVQLPGAESAIWLLTPWSAIEPVRERLGGQGRAGGARHEHDGIWRERLRLGVEASTLEVVASLGRVSMPLSRVSRLKVGDVIPIDSLQSVAVLIEDLELLHGTFGAREGQLAVRIGGQSGSPSRRF